MALAFGACSPRQYPVTHFAACYPNHAYDTVSFRWVNPPDFVIKFLSKRYSNYSLMVANSAALLNLLYEQEREKLKLKSDASALQHIVVLEKKEAILHRINLFRSEVASVAAELDCEGERADRLGVYLDNVDRIRTRNLTVASIVTGAIGGIASALLDGNASKTAAISGGGASAILGLISLSSQKKIFLKHPRNLLRDVWNVPLHSKDYPAMVWNMLSQATFSNGHDFSVIYYTRKQWEDIEGLKSNQKEIKLLMSDGGYYTANQLKLRANMINQLQAVVKLIDQDIQGLLSEIVRED